MILILDTSVVIDLILHRPPHFTAIAKTLQQAEVLAAPHLLDIEVAQVLRRFVLQDDLTVNRAEQALADYRDLPIHRYPHEPLLLRAFNLLHNLTVYDAVYVVLADALDATLLTRDPTLQGVLGTTVPVQLIGEAPSTPTPSA
jgi:predicted nucleic acid-binding protein